MLTLFFSRISIFLSFLLKEIEILLEYSVVCEDAHYFI